MSAYRPTPQQERWLAAAARLGVAKDTPWLIERSGGWKITSLLSRCAFFVLGVVAAALTTGILYLMHIPGPMFIAGVLAVIVTETLIVQRRLFGAGIEEALEIAGLLLVLAQVLDAMHINSDAAISLWVAIAFAHASARLLNPLFTTVAAAVLSFALYLTVRSGTGDYLFAAAVASVMCFGIAAVALAAGAMRFARPSIDRMLDWLVIAMPVCGYVWLAQGNVYGFIWASLNAGLLPLLPLSLVTAFAVIAALVGIRRRRHAPVLASLLCLACMGYELRNFTGLALEWRLILWGSIALLVTLVLNAWLRMPRNGITSNAVADGAESLQLLELVGVSSLGAQPTASAPSAYEGAGGGFGGGGASGKF